ALDGASPSLADVVVRDRQLQELVEVPHVEQVLIDAGDTRQQVRELLLQLRDPLDEQAEVADRYRAGCRPAQDDGRRRAHKSGGGERSCQPPAAAPPYERDELPPEQVVVGLPL